MNGSPTRGRTLHANRTNPNNNILHILHTKPNSNEPMRQYNKLKVKKPRMPDVLKTSRNKFKYPINYVKYLNSYTTTKKK